MVRPLIFGEVLFDCFEDNTKALGGAPFNVAWHLAGFGLNPLFISAVGDDELGKELLQRMEEFGMGISGVQIVDDKPTGKVIIKHPEGIGSHEFKILDNQAYDYINTKEVEKITKNQDFNFLYHGSLALRSEMNKMSLKFLLSSIKTKTFVDINLRPPFWSQELIINMIKGKDYIKLNESELERLDFLDEDSLTSNPKEILKKLNIKSILLTEGEKGAKVYFDSSKNLFRQTDKLDDFVDSIGAGDAFSAVYILGLINNWTSDLILKRAIDFASEICRIKGATFDKKEKYQGFLKKWNL